MPTIQRRIKLALLSGVLFAGIIVSMLVFSQDRATNPPSEIPSLTNEQTTTVSQDSVSYSGRAGVDALTLLEEKGKVEKTPAGFVSAINGRTADEGKREYWSFYVNGEPATVGAAEYKTFDADNIEWKIETY